MSTTIDVFLKHFIDGYLFHDLESMAAVSVPTGQNDGAAGYPIVATILAGMELLGTLLMPKGTVFKPNTDSSKYFLNFWDNYFAICHPSYATIGMLFRRLMRNGIVHVFVSKQGVFIEKGSGRQTSIDSSRNEVYLDCIIFLEEFRDTYNYFVLPLIIESKQGIGFSSMQGMLDQIINSFLHDTNEAFAKLPKPLNPNIIDVQKRNLAPLSKYISNLSNINSANASLPLSSHMIPMSEVDPFCFVNPVKSHLK